MNHADTWRAATRLEFRSVFADDYPLGTCVVCNTQSCTLAATGIAIVMIGPNVVNPCPKLAHPDVLEGPHDWQRSTDRQHPRQDHCHEAHKEHDGHTTTAAQLARVGCWRRRHARSRQRNHLARHPRVAKLAGSSTDAIASMIRIRGRHSSYGPWRLGKTTMGPSAKPLACSGRSSARRRDRVAAG